MNDIPMNSLSSVLFALALYSASAHAAPSQTAALSIPSFAPDDHTSWYPDRPDGDNFLPPESGPGPIISRPDRPYVPNSDVNDDFAADTGTWIVSM